MNKPSTQKTQSIRFDHVVHVDGQVIACEDYHAFREDGSFSGLPTSENCIGCHEEVQGEDPEEARYVAEYVKKGREVEWLVYQKQPDNVYFSHAAHKDKFECTACHHDLASMSTPPVYRENRLTSYSKSREIGRASCRERV